MKRQLTLTMLVFATVVLTAPTAQATCIVTTDASIAPNDVAFMGCAATGGGNFACNMNGVQDGWATHGVVASTATARIYSWTRNTIDTTEEYVCRLTPGGAGSGAAHFFTGIPGGPKDYSTFECRVDQQCD